MPFIKIVFKNPHKRDNSHHMGHFSFGVDPLFALFHASLNQRKILCIGGIFNLKA
jgi:hypothetical protein